MQEIMSTAPRKDPSPVLEVMLICCLRRRPRFMATFPAVAKSHFGRATWGDDRASRSPYGPMESITSIFSAANKERNVLCEINGISS